MSAPENNDQFKDEILEALKVVRDPEIPVNVVDLGLVYHLEVSDEGAVDIEMTLTSPGCPVMDMIQADAELAAMQVDGNTNTNVTKHKKPKTTTKK